jgi:short-subunit dehydrogenase
MVSTTISAALVALLAVALLWADCDFTLRVLPYSADEKNFNNQVIWLTGASSGIGASLAEELAAGGAQLILSARRVKQLEEVADKCAAVGLRPTIVPFDALNFDEHEGAFRTIIETFGRIDVLILNAGRAQRAVAMNTTITDSRNLFELNFFSYVSILKLVLPTMTSRKSGGQVVVVSSLAGKIGTPIASTYSATKYALHGYFDALRAEVHYKNINIQIVCPGPVISEISLHAIRSEGGKPSKEEKKMPTSRCTHLMATAMKWRLDEVWISRQPYLAITYLNTNFPYTSRQLFKHILGPGRVKALETGGDVYDLKALVWGKK